MNETVSNELRDSVMNEIVLADNQNHICFDCGSKEPKWVLLILGLSYVMNVPQDIEAMELISLSCVPLI